MTSSAVSSKIPTHVIARLRNESEVLPKKPKYQKKKGKKKSAKVQRSEERLIKSPEMIFKRGILPSIS